MPSFVQGQEKALSISVGGLSLKLVGMETQLRTQVRLRYAAFAEEGPGAGFPIRVSGKGTRRCSNRRGAFCFDVAGASLSLEHESAVVWSVRNEFALDSVLRVLLTRLLLPCPGFLLHAATVEHHGQAYVFMGRSGAGKSTVASLSPHGSVLTDEISLLRRIEGTWFAYGTPFWGEFRAAGQNRCVPVKRVLALAHAGHNRTVPLAARPALAALLGNTLFFGSGRQERETLLRAQMSVIESVPVQRLEFRQDQSLWEAAA